MLKAVVKSTMSRWTQEFLLFRSLMWAMILLSKNFMTIRRELRLVIVDIFGMGMMVAAFKQVGTAASQSKVFRMSVSTPVSWISAVLQNLPWDVVRAL